MPCFYHVRVYARRLFRSISLSRHFDYPAFLAQFRQRCAELGVDPIAGATSYQAACLRVDRRRAAHIPDYWWRDYALWTNSAPHHSSVEEAALERIFQQAFTRVGQLLDAQARQREILQQKWREQDKNASLRELLARREARLD